MGILGLPEHIEARIEPEPNSGCWLWTGPSYGKGYGGQRPHHGATQPRGAYRVVYALVRGPIPKGFCIDHLCRVRLCVNPAHLEAVTMSTNLRRGEGFIGVQARKTECLRGHPLSGDTLYVHNGHRLCRECARLFARTSYYRIMADPEKKLRYRRLFNENRRRRRQRSSEQGRATSG